MTATILLATLLAQPHGGDRLADEVAKLVEPKIERGDSVGIVVGIVRGDRTRVFGFGRVASGEDRTPDGRTLFEIGSITKVFTSTALADMAREGLVRLGDPVSACLPAEVRVPERDGKPITLRTLSNHTSGLPRVMPKSLALQFATGDPYGDIKPGDVFDFLKRANLSTVPGAKCSYSNLGGGLLGLALSRRTGTGYEELIVSRICRPLGMADTRVVLDDPQSRRLASPYVRRGVPAKSWHFDALAGAGALRSSADDMLTFARANLGLVPAPERLRAAMVDMRTPTADFGGRGMKIGLGWLILPARSKPDRPETLFHNGGTGGYRSYLAIVPEAKAAVVVLSNSASEVDTLGQAIMKVLFDAPPNGKGTAKALIEFGWDEPDTSFLRAHLTAMERTPFDGCVFHVDARPVAGKPSSLTWEGWGRRTFVESDVRSARDDLKSLRPARFSHNFLRFNTTPGDVDWFDDFAPILANARLAASLARDGRSAGILLDTEHYQGKPFSHAAQRDARTKPWSDYAAQARRRGREMMGAFQEGSPDLVVMLTFGPSLTRRQMLRGAKPLSEVEYGLLVPFIDGMVEASRGRTRIVDGFELSYGFKTPRDFEEGYRLMTEGVAPIVADAASYRRAVSSGFGIWLDNDWRRKGWDVADPSKNFFTPESFESSVRAALERSDEFVWIYTETPRWWSAGGGPVKLPAAYDAALRRARRGLAAD